MRDSGANQTINQVNIFGGYTRLAVDVPPPDHTVPVRALLTNVGAAVRFATGTPAGPVHLNCQFREPLAPSVAQWPRSLLKVPSTFQGFPSACRSPYSIEMIWSCCSRPAPLSLSALFLLSSCSPPVPLLLSPCSPFCFVPALLLLLSCVFLLLFLLRSSCSSSASPCFLSVSFLLCYCLLLFFSNLHGTHTAAEKLWCQ